jgi:hypothetical protein
MITGFDALRGSEDKVQQVIDIGLGLGRAVYTWRGYLASGYIDECPYHKLVRRQWLCSEVDSMDLPCSGRYPRGCRSPNRHTALDGGIGSIAMYMTTHRRSSPTISAGVWHPHTGGHQLDSSAMTDVKRNDTHCSNRKLAWLPLRPEAWDYIVSIRHQLPDVIRLLTYR